MHAGSVLIVIIWHCSILLEAVLLELCTLYFSLLQEMPEFRVGYLCNMLYAIAYRTMTQRWRFIFIVCVSVVTVFSIEIWCLCRKKCLPCFAFSEWMYRDSGVEYCQFVNCCFIIITNFESFEVTVNNLKISCIWASNVLLLGKMYCVYHELFSLRALLLEVCFDVTQICILQKADIKVSWSMTQNKFMSWRQSSY